MLLRDERLIALDCAIVSAKKAADAYEDCAAIAQDEAMTALFERLSRRRDAIAVELERHVVALGDLPSDPDVESETVGQVWRHLKVALSSDERQQLLSEAAALENQLTGCIENALAADIPETAREELLRIREEVAQDRARLKTASG